MLYEYDEYECVSSDILEQYSVNWKFDNIE